MRKAFGLAVAMMAAPAIAASTPAAPASTPSNPAADDNKVICKQQKASGTRFAKKKCMTKAQWDLMAEQHRRDAEEWLNKPTINPPGD